MLDDTNNALRRTLNSVLTETTASTGWIFYNDEMPASMNAAGFFSLIGPKVSSPRRRGSR